MKELALEISLLEIPLIDEITARYLEDRLRRIQLTYLIRVKAEGFLMICQVAPRPAGDFLTGTLSDRIHVKVVSRDDAGARILQVSGTWKQLFPSADGKAGKIVEFMSPIKKKPIFITENPSFREGILRIKVLAEQRTITSLLGEMKRAGIPFRVTGASSIKTRRESPLVALTARQASILRMAHSLGYYDVPKKAGVEDVARPLGTRQGHSWRASSESGKACF